VTPQGEREDECNTPDNLAAEDKAAAQEVAGVEEGERVEKGERVDKEGGEREGGREIFRLRQKYEEFQRKLLSALKEGLVTLETVISSRGYSISSITISRPECMVSRRES